jgi:hypothetical protein
MLGFINSTAVLRISRAHRHGPVDISFPLYTQWHTRNAYLSAQVRRRCRLILRSPSQLSKLTQPSPSTKIRSFQHQALKDPPDSPPKQPSNLGSETEMVSQAEQRRVDWTVTKRLLENVWPRNDWKTRGTVVLGFGLLIAGKV